MISSVSAMSAPVSFSPQTAVAFKQENQLGLSPRDSDAESAQDSNKAFSLKPTETLNQAEALEPSKEEKEKGKQEVEVASVVAQLKAGDREVRAHEQAHLAAGGSYASGMSFEYQQGPDGVTYAVGGEVRIDTSSISGDPQATIQKAQTILRAANAPAEPSGQDRSVASQASQMLMQAQSDLTQQRSVERSGGSDESKQAEQPIEGSGLSMVRKNEQGGRDGRENNANDLMQSQVSAERGLFETRLGLQKAG